jgi:Asp-tRNA(Asn)/Glu-tRNA(Gln) amidotransferase A subunit family amidase
MNDHAPLPADLAPSRRDLLAALAAAGVGTEVFQRALALDAEKPARLTADAIRDAEWVAGLTLSEQERNTVAGILGRRRRGAARLREVELDNSVPLPLLFDPTPGAAGEGKGGVVKFTEKEDPKKPESSDDLAFLSATELAALLRARKVSSEELTKLYLDRLEKYDPALFCVVTRTEKTALEQARQADKDIAAGRYRGPLHGIPWGAKDLIAYPGYPTTWGAEPYKDQRLDVKATVARKLDEAGAVLVAKLSLGALAYGDGWFGKRMTRNPWNVKQGSRGSSAGSASATSAGLVGFALGSETLGSIVSPSIRCRVTGLRPTFGRVSRHGCMTLCWSMDKIGPLARSAEDCAMVFAAIHGRDGLDASAVDRPFSWPSQRAVKTLKVGYLRDRAGAPELEVLKKAGVQLVGIDLPGKLPIDELTVILHAEAAAAFDDLLRRNPEQTPPNWKASFQASQFIPAVEYLRANRIRALLMRAMAEVMSKVDLYVGSPNHDLVLTNLTGHPQLLLPALAKRNGREVPAPVLLTGRLFGESELLSVGQAFQRATDYHLRRPPLGGK